MLLRLATIRRSRKPLKTRLRGSDVPGLTNIFIVTLWVLLAGFVHSQESDELKMADKPVSPELQGIDIVEHLGDKLPLDLEFVNENGETVTLGSYFNQDKPVIVNLVYYTCPMLCNLVLNGLTDTLKEVSYTPGEDFTIVTISIDPTETAELAKSKKAGYIAELGKPDAASGWHWHVGEDEQIRALADAVGFRYKYDKRRQEYAHTAALFMITPDGTISRYLYGVQYQPKQMRLALLEASDGKIGSSIDRWIMRCYHYDPAIRRYRIYAMSLMRLGGLITMTLLGGGIGIMLLVERRKKKLQKADSLSSDLPSNLGENTH